MSCKIFHESISSTLYEKLFAPILFCQKITKPNQNYGKAAQNTFLKKVLSNMFIKLTPGVNFTKKIWGAFLPTFFCQKITKPNCKKRKVAKHFCTKKLVVKCWVNQHQKNMYWDESPTRSEQIRCQFHQRFYVQIFWQSQNVTRKMTFVRKICAFNVDEIDGRRSLWGISWSLRSKAVYKPRSFYGQLWKQILSLDFTWCDSLGLRKVK